MATATPQLKLYTNHGCPWAHRAHIALSELNLPFEEEIIDLTVPRTAEYLKINPRGLVPSLVVDNEIVTESAIVATFLADAFPSHLVPPTSDPSGPLRRARISFFVDTFINKVNGSMWKSIRAETEKESAEAGNEIVEAIVKEIEPLLSNASPYFDGSDKLTLAEVLTGSFVVRIWTWPKYKLLPQNLVQDLSAKAPNFSRWAEAVSKHPSVIGIYDEEVIAERTKERLASARLS